MLSKKYSDLSRSQLLEKARVLGSDFERFSGSCSQCTAAALKDILGFEDLVVKVASSSCGGQAGLSTGVCGGLIGGTIVLDYYLGRPAAMLSSTETIPGSQEKLGYAMEAARLLGTRFIDTYGSILCPGVQTQLYGRVFDLQDPKDWQAFMDAGAHTDPTKCMSVVGNSAAWTLEILLEKGVIG